MNADQNRIKSEFAQSALTDKVLGVYYDVYNELGFGFLESVYAKAMAVALEAAGLQVDTETAIAVWFREFQVGDFRADLVVEKSLLLELKAVRTLEPAHEAQTLNYLRATELEVALLLNFGPKPQIRRLVFDNQRKKISVHQRQSAAKGF
jgi:GxxExxY protein